MKTSVSKTSFSQATGISTVILSHISSGRNKVSLSAVEQVLQAYPNVNAEWLILGKGQMFKDGLEKDKMDELEARIEALSSELNKSKKSLELKVNELKAAVGKFKI